MAKRTTVEFPKIVDSIFEKYSKIYGIKNICSLGLILIDQLKPEDREMLIEMLSNNVPLDSIKKRANADDTKIPAALKGVAKDKQEKAIQRRDLLERFELYAATCKAVCITRTEALIKFCHENGISTRSMERWLKNYQQKGILGLVDNRGNHKK